jgi:hypothetical protein
MQKCKSLVWTFCFKARTKNWTWETSVWLNQGFSLVSAWYTKCR